MIKWHNNTYKKPDTTDVEALDNWNKLDNTIATDESSKKIFIRMVCRP
jgi:hypothetical protein